VLNLIRTAWDTDGRPVEVCDTVMSSGHPSPSSDEAGPVGQELDGPSRRPCGVDGISPILGL
jgi:hypothetical protein